MSVQFPSNSSPTSRVISTESAFRPRRGGGWSRGVARWLGVVGLAAAMAAPVPVVAAGGGGGGAGGGAQTGWGGGNADAAYNRAVAAIRSGDMAQAIPLLKDYLGRHPDDANGENWLAFAYRKSGQLDEAFAHYAAALRLNPDHRGAHEYVGEAYLTVGNLAKAEEHLRILDRLCLLPCEEYSDLKAAVAAYRANQPGAPAR